MKTSPRVVLVTGGNRGIGLEVCRQLAKRGHKVLLGTRDRARGEAAARKISGDVEVIVVDVADPDAAQRVASEIKARYGRLDVLVNNAGIHYDTWQSVETADWKIFREAFEVNVFGAWRMAQALVPMMRKAKWGRIVNVSSEAGSLASMGAGTPAYSTTKASLNALTGVLAAEVRDAGILVNAVCPGWTATDMGGSGGRPVAEGAASVIWAVDLPDDGPSGGFFRDGKPLPW
jgi:NAD(P)-dependent dehydrogenase (short-subunit alcohol dehydrogenase family)